MNFTICLSFFLNKITEYKRAKSELKKRSTDTFRLQKKKARKGQVGLGGGGISALQGVVQSGGRTTDEELSRLLESSVAVVNEKRLSLEETERKAVRAALLEERGRYCLLARFLKPVLVRSLIFFDLLYLNYEKLNFYCKIVNYKILKLEKLDLKLKLKNFKYQAL